MITLRPTVREIDKRLKEAQKALLDRKVLFANPTKALGELWELDIESVDDVWNLMLKLLVEVDRDCYSGMRPPQRSYEKAVENKELWAFTWESPLLGKRMYLKFVVKEGTFYYISLHESRGD